MRSWRHPNAHSSSADTQSAQGRWAVSNAKIDFGGDRRWVLTQAALISLEFAWWIMCWAAGTAPAPHLGTYLALAFVALSGAMALRLFLRPRAGLASWPAILVGTVLVGLGASLFLPLKYAIPREIPFWLDVFLAIGERHIFGADPWIILDHIFGWALVPVDRIYGLWLPTQSLVLFSVMILPASPAKSRALIAYNLAWFLLGAVAALLFSSAGPLFYDTVFGETAFASLTDTLRSRGAWVALAESDRMRQSLVSGQPGFVAGISAVPSIHVAISLWMFLTARILTPRLAPIAGIYFAFIWLGSVQLGWHYVSDGLIGAAGMLAIWVLARRIANCRSDQDATESNTTTLVPDSA